MNHRTALTALLITLCLAIHAQDAELGLTASKCLSEAPTSIFTLIDNNTRLDMIDYYEAGLDRASTNALGGECRITSMDAYQATLQGGNGIEYQIFVLNPTDPLPIIGVVETLSTPVDESRVQFYNSRWHRLTVPLLEEPRLSDWMTDKSKPHREEVEQEIPFIMATYSYDPDTKNLTVTNNMAQYYVPTDTPNALKYLKDSLVYTWTGRNFKLKK